VYQFTFAQQRAPDNSEVHRSLESFGSLVWKLLCVTLLALRIRRWFLEFWDIFTNILLHNYTVQPNRNRVVTLITLARCAVLRQACEQAGVFFPQWLDSP
jgi:hypothetical protein